MIKNGINMSILRMKLLSNDYLKVDQAFLRGSYANGSYDYKSDLDLFIISDDFASIDIMKRKDLVKSILEPILCMQIDSICLTKHEYELVIMDKQKNIRYDEMVEII